MELWKILISAANNAFIHRQHLLVVNQYETALEIATGITGLLAIEDMTHLLNEVEREIAAFIVTHHNLVDLYRQCPSLSKTVEHLCKAHETLFQLSHHNQGEIRLLAIQHTKVTYQELIAFTQCRGHDSRIQQTLLLTQYMCNCCRKKLGH